MTYISHDSVYLWIQIPNKAAPWQWISFSGQRIKEVDQNKEDGLADTGFSPEVLSRYIYRSCGDVDNETNNSPFSAFSAHFLPFLFTTGFVSIKYVSLRTYFCSCRCTCRIFISGKHTKMLTEAGGDIPMEGWAWSWPTKMYQLDNLNTSR